MFSKKDILKRIKKSVNITMPEAVVILYGSYARNEERKYSDIDIIILLKKENFSRETEIKIKYPLYDIEFETGTIISPLIFSEKEWKTKHRITPFYHNVMKEGVVL